MERGRSMNEAPTWGLDLGAQGMGVDATDLDHDGYLDLYISNNLPNDLFLSPGPQPEDGPILPFTNITETAGVGDWGMGWGTAFIDHDHDGERDLYVANEYFFSYVPEPALPQQRGLDVHRHRSGRGHRKPIQRICDGRGRFRCQWHGGLAGGQYAGQHQSRLSIVPQRGHHDWIGFELEGVVSPRDAAGARVVVHAAPDYIRTDQSFIGYSYSSCGPLTFNFGLADHATVDSVEFFWPSGLRTVMLDPAVDVYHTVLETPCLGLSPDVDWPLEVSSCVPEIRCSSLCPMAGRRLLGRGCGWR